MKTRENFSLRQLNTFGVEACAGRAVFIETPDDVERLGADAFNPATDLVLGGGSNILFSTDVAGTVFLNRLKGRQVIQDDGDRVLVDVAAGENWHEFVLWSLQQGFCGLENLSLIPGLAGAAPMQNIGAYGVEVSSLMDSVEVLDWTSGQVQRINANDCGFAYRDSRFKSTEPGRFLILSCRMLLSRNGTTDISFAGLAEELAEMGITSADAKQVSDAVIRIRQRKLPDPGKTGNAGSFFKNPLITRADAESLQASHPGMPVFPAGDNLAKLSAAWMIESCGWKGYREGDAGVSDMHALVLVNHGNATGREILNLARRIAESVQNQFEIRLEQEPQIFGQSF